MQNARVRIRWRRRFPAWSRSTSATTGFRTASGTTISDVATGVYAFQAIATALFARASVGTGRWIDVNLAQSTAALLGHKAAEYVLEGGTPRALNVPAGSYQTSDGWMMVTLVNEAQYKRLCAAIGREDLASDPRFADFAGRADFGRRADGATARGVSVAIQRNLARPASCGGRHRRANPHPRRLAAQCPCRGDQGRGLSGHARRRKGLCRAHAGHRGTCRRIICGPAPDIGADSREVLLEAGFDSGAIDSLISAGIVRTSLR